jgi:hypothetical protein
MGNEKYLVFWPLSLVNKTTKHFPLHRQRKLTRLSFRDGNISSTLFNIIFGTLVARDLSIFCKFKTRSSHMKVCGLQKKVARTSLKQLYTSDNKMKPEREHIDYISGI